MCLHGFFFFYYPFYTVLVCCLSSIWKHDLCPPSQPRAAIFRDLNPTTLLIFNQGFVQMETRAQLKQYSIDILIYTQQKLADNLKQKTDDFVYCGNFIFLEMSVLLCIAMKIVGSFTSLLYLLMGTFLEGGGEGEEEM